MDKPAPHEQGEFIPKKAVVHEKPFPGGHHQGTLTRRRISRSEVEPCITRTALAYGIFSIAVFIRGACSYFPGGGVGRSHCHFPGRIIHKHAIPCQVVRKIVV